jgi:hypothetical protein
VTLELHPPYGWRQPSSGGPGPRLKKQAGRRLKIARGVSVRILCYSRRSRRHIRLSSQRHNRAADPAVLKRAAIHILGEGNYNAINLKQEHGGVRFRSEYYTGPDLQALAKCVKLRGLSEEMQRAERYIRSRLTQSELPGVVESY